MKVLGNLHRLDKRHLNSTMQISPLTRQREQGCFSRSGGGLPAFRSRFLLLPLSVPFLSASSVFTELASPGLFLFCVSSRYCWTALSTSFSTSLLLSLTSSASSGSPPFLSPASDGGSPAEAGVSCGSLQGQGHWQQKFWEALPGLSPPGVHHQPHQGPCGFQCWVTAGQTTNREGTQPPCLPFYRSKFPIAITSFQPT